MADPHSLLHEILNLPLRCKFYYRAGQTREPQSTVRPTLPAVGAAIGDIADRFYEGRVPT